MTYEVVCDSKDDRGAWLKARRSGIGASEIAAVLGESPWQSALALWRDKTSDEEPVEDNAERLRWGQILEPVISQEYIVRTGRPTFTGGLLLRSSEYPWMLATLDAWTSIEPLSSSLIPRHPLEIKTASAYVADKWTDGPPREYYLQLQQQMIVTGAQMATIVCLLGGQQLVWADVHANITEQRRIIAQGEAFWKAVLERDPPAPDSSDSASRALAQMFAEENGETIELVDEFLRDDIDSLMAAKMAKKEAERTIARVENALKAAIGSASGGVYADGTSVTWKTIKRAGFTVQPTRYRKLVVKTGTKEETEEA